jgi:hypothetical protein
MWIVLLTRVTTKGYTQHTTLNEIDGSLRQFEEAADAEVAGHDLLEVKRIY